MRHVALAVILLAIFLASTLWVRSAIALNAQTQQHLQNAQYLRGRLLKLQLDEETGVRGYVATRSQVFLEPYESARRHFAPISEQLDRTVTALGIGNEDVWRERAINSQWLSNVAIPMLRNPSRISAKTQRLGKFLVDAFRDSDNRLTAAIAYRSNEATAVTNGLVSRVLFGSVALGILIVLVVIGYGFAQNRLARRLERSQVAYEKERRAVEVLQNAFLRPQLPSFANVVLYGAYAPARDETRVGGDWYDAYAFSERQLLFSIGDVSGHGLEAAVVMSRVRQSITAAAMTESDPADLLRVANEVLLLQEGPLVTAACGFVNLESGRISFATAGHPPILYVRSSGLVELLATGGPPMGAILNAPYKSANFPIEAGASLVLYTDGLTENAHDTVEGERALIEAVRGIHFDDGNDSAAAILASIFPGVAPSDDVAILTVTFAQASARTLRVVCA